MGSRPGFQEGIPEIQQNLPTKGTAATATNKNRESGGYHANCSLPNILL